jgi:hypothetical protein
MSEEVRKCGPECPEYRAPHFCIVKGGTEFSVSPRDKCHFGYVPAQKSSRTEELSGLELATS